MAEINNDNQSSAENYLLTYDKRDKSVKGVKGITPDGELDTLPATQENKHQFIKVDQHGNPLSNFYQNFMSNYNRPQDHALYKVGANEQPEEAKARIESAQKTEDIDLKREMNKGRIYNNHKFNEREIDWKQAEKWGLTKEVLSYKDSLERMLQGKRSAISYRIRKETDTGRDHGDARLSLFRDNEGKVKFDVHYLCQEPNLNEPFRGYTFTPEDKENLMGKSGNLGKVVDLIVDFRTKETKPCYVSRDTITNEMMILPANSMTIPRKIMGVTLTDNQYEALKAGKEVPELKFISSKGKEFTTGIQVNAVDRGIELLFERGTKVSQDQAQNQKQEPKQSPPDATTPKQSPPRPKQSPTPKKKSGPKIG